MWPLPNKCLLGKKKGNTKEIFRDLQRRTVTEGGKLHETLPQCPKGVMVETTIPTQRRYRPFGFLARLTDAFKGFKGLAFLMFSI